MLLVSTTSPRTTVRFFVGQNEFMSLRRRCARVGIDRTEKEMSAKRNGKFEVTTAGPGWIAGFLGVVPTVLILRISICARSFSLSLSHVCSYLQRTIIPPLPFRTGRLDALVATKITGLQGKLCQQ